MMQPPLKELNRQKLITNLGSELLPLLEVARAALDSWPVRMKLERVTGQSEERLEMLAAQLEAAVTASAEGGAPLGPPPREAVVSSYMPGGPR